MNTKFGKKLQTRRIEKGFASQTALAKAIGTYHPQVNKWETGKAFPDVFYKQKLKEILGVGDEFFLDQPEDSTQPKHPSQKAELIAAIVLSLGSLNHDELQAILASIRALPSQASSAKSTAL